MAKYAITAANRGIGLEMAKQLLERGDEVVALCREASDELKQTSAKVIKDVDVTNYNDLKRAAQKTGVIDHLINVAGIMKKNNLDQLNEAGFTEIEEQFQINALGVLKAVSAFLPNMREGAKIIIITSRMGSITDNTSGGSYGYRMSKAAVNMAGVSLAHDLKQHSIAVGILHPGFVKTRMTGFSGHVEPKESAANLIQRIDELNIESSGKFIHANGEELPW